MTSQTIGLRWTTSHRGTRLERTDATLTAPMVARSPTPADAGTHERVGAGQDRDAGIGGGGGERAQPRIGDRGGPQQVRGVPVLGCGPGILVGAQVVGHEHPRVQDGAIGKLADDGREGVRSTLGEQAAEGGAGRPGRCRCAGRRGAARAADGQLRAGAQAALLGQEADPAADAPLQPGQRTAAAPARDEQLTAGVRGQGAELVQPREGEGVPGRGATHGGGEAGDARRERHIAGVSRSMARRSRPGSSMTRTPARSSSQRGRALSDGSGGRSRRIAARPTATMSEL